MRTKLLILVTLTAPLFLIDWSAKEKSSGGEVDALYWHGGSRYTVKDDNGGLITSRTIPPWGSPHNGNVIVYSDLAPGEKTWYLCEWDWSWMYGTMGGDANCEIHIHGLDDIIPGNWDHGKFGRGSITRIE